MSKANKPTFDREAIEALLARQDIWKDKAEEVAVDLRKFFDETVGDDITAGKLLARLIEEFDLDDFPKSEVHVGELYLEWTVGEYMNRKGPGLLRYIEFIYQQLVKRGFKLDKNQKGEYEWNDLDNHMWYVPHDEFNIFCITTQNVNWLVIHKHDEKDPLERNQFSVYRYWDPISDWAYDDVLEEIKGKDDESLVNFLLHGLDVDRYSDNVKGNQYISRPDFQWYVDQGFDFGKIGKNCFVRSTFSHCESPMRLGEINDRPNIRNYSLIQTMAFDIACAHREAQDLEGDEK